jgi:hypothetical protein
MSCIGHIYETVLTVQGKKQADGVDNAMFV